MQRSWGRTAFRSGEERAGEGEEVTGKVMQVWTTGHPTGLGCAVVPRRRGCCFPSQGLPLPSWDSGPSGWGDTSLLPHCYNRSPLTEIAFVTGLCAP